MKLFTLSAVAASLAFSAAAMAAYPDRPIKLIVPAAAGGNSDGTMRIIAQEMSKALGQQVVVDNRTGAGGRIGSELIARAAPDGYTIGYAHVGTLVINRHLFRKLSYDPAKDFAFIGTVGMVPNVIVVAASSPYKTLAELIQAAKKDPEKLTMASADAGTSSHVGAALFRAQTGALIRNIPYKATAGATTDLLGGQVDSLTENLPPFMSLIQSGKVRALAVTTSRRAAQLPQVPTVAESGFPNYEQSAWGGLVAPAGTPRDIIDKLNHTLNTILKSAELRKAFEERSLEPLTGTPEDLGALAQRESPKWEAVIKAAGVQLD